MADRNVFSGDRHPRAGRSPATGGSAMAAETGRGQQTSRHGIVARTAPGMAARQPLDRQPAALERPVFPHGLQRVLRAGGRKPARSRKPGRNTVLVYPDQQQKQPFQWPEKQPPPGRRPPVNVFHPVSSRPYGAHVRPKSDRVCRPPCPYKPACRPASKQSLPASCRFL